MSLTSRCYKWGWHKRRCPGKYQGSNSTCSWNHTGASQVIYRSMQGGSRLCLNFIRHPLTEKSWNKTRIGWILLSVQIPCHPCSQSSDFVNKYAYIALWFYYVKICTTGLLTGFTEQERSMNYLAVFWREQIFKLRKRISKKPGTILTKPWSSQSAERWACIKLTAAGDMRASSLP